MFRCPGTLSRRSFLRTGLVGLSTLGLADLFRLRGQAGTPRHPASPGAAPSPKEKSIILLWLWGGPSHMETFDLKPDAPAEFRGEFRPIKTSLPGIEISEHLPKLARVADRFSLIRSLHHDSTGHVNSTHTLLTGYPGEVMEAPPFKPRYPDAWAVTSKLRGAKKDGVPPYVALPRTRYNGAAYLGNALDPLVVSADPSAPSFQVPNLNLTAEAKPRFDERLDLLKRFDTFRRDIDTSGVMGSLDEFNQKAVTLLTGDAVRRAFDLGQETPQVRDRYGRHAVGQQCLLARRLVEAGVRVVTVDFPCVPGQKAFSWDDHASVWNIFEQMKIRLPVLDQVTSALITDISERGLHNEVMFVVMGEMSHTPKLSNFKGQPGREHWGQAMSVLVSGGGLEMGQVVGSTNSRGEEPRTDPVSANDLLATWYHVLGVPLDGYFSDHTGRPIPLLPSGKPIEQLVG